MNKSNDIPKIEVKPMAKNRRMAILIENLAGLEKSDWHNMSEDGRKYIGNIWNLLGLASQEEIHKSREK